MKKSRRKMLILIALGGILLAGGSGIGRTPGNKEFDGTGRGTPVTEHYTASGADVSVGTGEVSQGKTDLGKGEDEGEEESRSAFNDEQNSWDETEKRIALTFDDGPHPTCTVKLLDGLRERGVHVTFFLVGSQVEQYPEVVQQMAEDGHLIGSHTYSHAQLTSLSLRDACEELAAANEAIFQACGHVVTYVRPPYGLWSDVLNCSVNLTEVGWTIDPEDWKVLNTAEVTEHVVSHVQDGAIILLHDIYDTSVEAAFQIIDRLRADGWEFVTVDELILD